MRVDNRVDVRPLAVDPHMKAGSGIGPAALQGLEVRVDEDHAIGCRLVEPVAELQGPPGPGFLGARSYLAGKAGLVAFARQDAASAGQGFPRREVGRLEVLLHLAADPVHEVRFFVHCAILKQSGSDPDYLRLARPWVIAPRCAEPTNAAYFSSTPETGARFGATGFRFFSSAGDTFSSSNPLRASILMTSPSLTSASAPPAAASGEA